VYKFPFPPLPFPAFVFPCCLEESHFDWGEIKSQYSFDLHFYYGQECWLFLHVFPSHLYFMFWKLSVQFIWPYITWFIYYFDHYFLNILCTLDINLLFNKYWYFFSPLLKHFSILVISSFDIKKLFNLVEFLLLESYSESHFLYVYHQVISYSCFKVSVRVLSSFIHFELIVQCER
jgi:hypothetical protein